MIPNKNYANLKDSYLFRNISKRINDYLELNKDKKIYRMGIGDVSLPLCKSVITSLHNAVDNQSKKESFHGYMDECGDEVLRSMIAKYYGIYGVNLKNDEVFVSSGASDELGDILSLFGKNKKVLILEPAYPAYVDANIIEGNEIISLSTSKEEGFLPLPKDDIECDVIYICSPNNPTGATYDKEGLKLWVNFANKKEAIIIFDAAYEAFIEDESIPHSIFQIDGARTCSIEICSLSKTAGFTGTRLGYTVVPHDLERDGMSLHSMWVRNRTTKTNGVSYILQEGAKAVFTEEGRREIMENISYYKENARILMNAIDELGLWYCGGKNAPYIWLECPKGMTSWDFFDELLNKAQVVGTPGSGFGKCGEGYFRFSTFSSREDTIEAANRLKWLIQKW